MAKRVYGEKVKFKHPPCPPSEEGGVLWWDGASKEGGICCINATATINPTNTINAINSINASRPSR